MKPVFISTRWLLVPVTFSLLAASAEAQNRTVKLTVNVLSAKQKPVAGANVTIAPSTGPAVNTETQSDGSVTVDVPVGAARFGEGWLSSEPTINITAKKESDTGSTVVNVRTKSFNAGTAVEIARTVTLSPPPAPLTATSTTRLTVTVVDENGGPVSGASVSLSRDVWGPDSVLYDNRMETGSDGVASTDIQIKGDSRSFGEGWLYSPTFDVEIRKDDLSGKDRFQIVGGNTSQGYRYPQYIARSVIVRNFEHGQQKAKAIINVAVDVSDEEHTSIEGARVLITDPTLGAATGRFVGVTGADGRTTIPFWWTTSGEVNFGVRVSRTGYRDKETFITLNENQVGTTVWSGTIALEKLKPGEEGVAVNVKVLNKKNGRGVVEANVVLDGGGGAYYSDATNGQGDVAFNVTQTGTFAVRITHSNLLPFSDEIRLVADDKNKQRNFTFQAEGKDNAEQGEDTLEVTVLGKESGDDKAATVPVAGAEVRSGAIVGTTGNDGVVPLHGAFQGEVYLTVRADGYKTKVEKRNFRNYYKKQLQGLLPKVGQSLIADEWKTKIVLEPELTNQSAIRLSIDVRDPKGNGIPNAKLDFSAADGTFLPLKDVRSSTRTDSDGNFLFQSSNLEEQDVAALRKGLVVSLTAKGFKDIPNRSIPADMLEPSTKTTPFLIEMERDWSDLLAAINALEPRVLAWNNNLAALRDLLQGIPKLEAEVTKIGERATRVSNEIDQMRAKFSGVNGQTTASMRCDEVERLKKNIEDYSKKASEKEDAMRKALDQANQLSARCEKVDDADQIRKGYDQAIKLAGEIGALEKKAVKDSNALKDLAKDQVDLKDTTGDLENKINDLVQDSAQADKVAGGAGQVVVRAQKINDSLKSGYLALSAELDKLKKTFGLDKSNEGVPPEMLKRVDAMEKLLAKKSGDVFSAPGPDLVKSIQATTDAIKNKKDSAEKLLADYKRNKKNSCDVDSMDDAVQAIGTIVAGSIIEVGAAADLPAKANDCARKIADASNQVEVPDLSTLNDLGAMTQAADRAGMVLKPAATSAAPPAGSQRLFGPQNPQAKSKAKRGDPLTILVYQKLAEKSTPTPTPIAVATPSPDNDEIVVPDVSRFKDPDAMLAGAGPDMVGMLVAVRNAPPPGTTTLYSHQDPPANTKSKRGKPLTIYVYQTLAEARPSPTEEPVATPAPSAGAGTMPSLIGMTIEQASAALPAGARIGSDEIGSRRPKTPEERPLTIYYQYPPAGQVVEAGTSVTIMRFGSADSVASAEPSPTPVLHPGDKIGGPTDITNTTGGEFWGGTPAPSPPKRTVARKKSPTPPPKRKKKTSDWWRQHGHDRPDYEVPNN